MEDLSILARIRAARLQPRTSLSMRNAPVYIKAYDKRVTIYFYDELLLNYRYVAVSSLDNTVYLEFSNVQSSGFYSISKRENSGQTLIGGSNKKVLEKYVGSYNYVVVAQKKTTSLIIKLKRN